jgi:sec-independent protein translocase protein TatA
LDARVGGIWLGRFFQKLDVQVRNPLRRSRVVAPGKGDSIVLAVINDTGILVVLVAVVLLFGASQIPKLARNLGEASKEFRKAHEDADRATGSTPDQIALNRAQLEALLASAPQNPRVEDARSQP